MTDYNLKIISYVNIVNLSLFHLLFICVVFGHGNLDHAEEENLPDPSESSKPKCIKDDGQNGIEIDLLNKTTKCDHHWKLKDISHLPPYTICYKPNQLGVAHHVCINEPIDSQYPADQIPNSGPHREKWAMYGEYDYLPPGRFVHNLEHGAVVFLYHPCTPVEMIAMLRYLANNCTWKHTLSPYSKLLNQQRPMAVLVYGCEYRMSRINITDIQHWIQTRQPSPEPTAFGQGQYNHGLLQLSNIPPHPEDDKTPFCANVSEEAMLKSLVHSSPPKNKEPPSKTPRTEEAAWAVGSLLFLLVGLVCSVCYTQLWKKGNHGESFEQSRVWSDGNTRESVSVAAIVRKFPHMLKNKVSRSKRVRSSKDNKYQLLDENSFSEEEV